MSQRLPPHSFAWRCPSPLADRLDFTSIEPRPEHFVDPKLAGRETDLLFRVRIDGRAGFIYLLFEHQSTVDRLMAWRLLQYLVRIWDAWRGEHPAAENLPLIVPVVLYHGRNRWTAPMDFRDLVSEATVEGVRGQVPSFSYLLFDLRSMSTDEIVGLAGAAAVRLLLLVLKHVHDRRLPELLAGWHELLRKAVRAEPGGLRLVELLLTYLAAAGRRITDEDLESCGRALGPAGEQMAMTLAQQWRNEGRQEGRQEGIELGKRDLLVRMLTLKFGDLPESAAQHVEKASAKDLDQWAEKLLSAASLEEVLGPRP